MINFIISVLAGAGIGVAAHEHSFALAVVCGVVLAINGSMATGGSKK